MEKLVRDDSPLEFFRERLEQAMAHQRVSTSAFTEYYLADLLAGAVRGGPLVATEPGYDETPLALLYVRALHSHRHERARLLKQLADTALFVSGFFAESLERRLVDLDYYRSMGGAAYARLSRELDTRGCGGVFGELSDRFVEFSDLLQEVSETTRLATPQSVVRLYERWLQTRSRRAASLLQEQGIHPVAAAESRLQ
jgi:hypothetical protein